MSRVNLFLIFAHMKRGEEIQLPISEVMHEFPADPILGGTWRDRLMSNLIGSAYGEWKVDELFDGRTVRIRRQEPRADGKMVYADVDRRHLFDEQPDGTLRRNELPYERADRPASSAARR